MDRLCRLMLALAVAIAAISMASLVIRTAPGSLMAIALVVAARRWRTYR